MTTFLDKMYKALKFNRQLVIILLFMGSVFLGIPAVSQPVIAQGDIYLPLIFKAPCALPAEQAVADLMEAHSSQGRASLTCNDILANVARYKAQDMANRGYFSHITPEGHGPNYLVTQAGYVLPDFYSSAKTANNIESIAAGTNLDTANDVWQVWLNSPSHQDHLLGLNSFYADQIEYGIGFAADPTSPYIYYWVLITAKPGP